MQTSLAFYFKSEIIFFIKVTLELFMEQLVSNQIKKNVLNLCEFFLFKIFKRVTNFDSEIHFEDYNSN